MGSITDQETVNWLIITCGMARDQKSRLSLLEESLKKELSGCQVGQCGKIVKASGDYRAIYIPSRNFLTIENKAVAA